MVESLYFCPVTIIIPPSFVMHGRRVFDVHSLLTFPLVPILFFVYYRGKMQPSSRSVLKRKVQELTVLYEIGQLLVSSPDPKEALNPILKILHSRMGMERGTITILKRP
jgi:hypothetical protein